MEDIIAKYEKELTEIFRREGVVLAYLFGSQARGATHHFSDIDVGVLLDKSILRETYFDKVVVLLSELGRVFGRERIDIVILNRAKPFLRYQVVFGGKLLFEKDEGTRVFFENRTMKEYQDTRHILQFSLNAMKERMKKGFFGVNPRSAYGTRS